MAIADGKMKSKIFNQISKFTIIRNIT